MFRFIRLFYLGPAQTSFRFVRSSISSTPMKTIWLLPGCVAVGIALLGVACVGDTPAGTGPGSSSGESSSGSTSSSSSSGSGGSTSSGGGSSGQASSSSGYASSSGDVPDSGTARMLVFVTSTKVKGDFAVDAGTPWAAADAICATDAAGAGLTGSYRALLSYQVGETDYTAAGRIPDTAYYLPGSVTAPEPVQITTSRANLFANGPSVPINRLASGQPASEDEGGNRWIWTGSNENGSPAYLNCKSWTNGSAALSGGAGNAREILDASSSPSDWIQFGGRTCDAARRLYCFQVQ